MMIDMHQFYLLLEQTVTFTFVKKVIMSFFTIHLLRHCSSGFQLPENIFYQNGSAQLIPPAGNPVTKWNFSKILQI